MQEKMLKEIIFSVSINLDDVYEAEAFCYSITVRAEKLGELRCRVRAAAQCFFEESESKPALIRLHFSHDEKISIFHSPDQESQWQKACLEYSENAILKPESNPEPISGFSQTAVR